MILIIVFSVLLILGIIGIVVSEKFGIDSLSFFCVVITTIAGVGILIISIVFPVKFNQAARDISTFAEQKKYIEEIVPTLPETDNYAITQMKIEQNEWLYEVQYNYEHFTPWLYFLPAEVMELEPIK